MKISFKNTKTGEIRQVKVGFSWILFFFAGFLGIPLFLRKLNIWGAIFLAMWLLNLVFSSFPSTEDLELSWWILVFVALGLEIYMGIKGNELTAKNYLENGWEFANELNDEATIKFAKIQWRLA